MKLMITFSLFFIGKYAKFVFCCSSGGSSVTDHPVTDHPVTQVTNLPPNGKNRVVCYYTNFLCDFEWIENENMLHQTFLLFFHNENTNGIGNFNWKIINRDMHLNQIT